ncbi:hypothetical protein GGS20DRAFT_316260 [Poronia punctata]|nr:hypothetical protein GGS20DRAFT_316260 [Poronia punctata]
MTSTGSAEYGKRLIPHIIDDVAHQTPDREILLTPRSGNPKDGWASMTFRHYANAINRCAWDIVDRYGVAPKGEFPTIAYIGPQDARYLILLVACIKAGYKVLFVSPRNSQKAHINLFDKTDCRVLWFSESFSKVVEPWLEERDMQTLQVKPLEQWFSVEATPLFPYEKTFEEAEWDPFCVLHTSGSTGLPKPVTVRTGMMAISDKYQQMGKWQGTNYWLTEWHHKVTRQFIPMPLFHAAAIYTFFYTSVYRDMVTVLSIGEKTLTADLVVECRKNVHFDGAFLPPSILEDVSQSQELIDIFSQLKMIIIGGGSIAREAGDRLVKHRVRIFNSMNATEFGSFPVYYHENPELWAYFKFNTDAFGAEWRPVDDDDTYELVIVRKEKEPGLQGFFYTFPELNEYSTKDLYKRHPTYPDFYIYHGRADNIIVFSNGEKLNPVTIEDTVQDHPDVQGALVIGSNKFQAGLLLEPVQSIEDEEDKRRLIDSVWPLVEKANHDSVAHGRISKELISVVKPNKPFFRSGKGTIQRAATVQLYSEEIDHLYEEAERGPMAVPSMNIRSEDSIMELIFSTFRSQSGEKTTTMGSDTDFFSVGIDSLDVMNASRTLRATLGIDQAKLSSRFLYRNPTPRRLAQYILRIIDEDGTTDSESEAAEEIQTAKMLYERYTRSPTRGKPGRPEAPSDNQTILLTGSTGTLGSYLLDQLVRNPSIDRVVCLNRAEDGGAKQQQRQMQERDLALDSDKVEFLHVDLSKERLGLTQNLYARLLKETHRIIHNAWPVNFNISTETFEPHIRGVGHLANLAAEAEHRVAVVFISSISTVHGWDSSRGPVPEQRMEDWSLASNSYGLSKMIGSLVLEDAAVAGDFPAASIRVGQIAGPEAQAGAWNTQEWFPSIIASSLHIGALPRELGSNSRVDWMPVERVARLVLEVVGASPGQRAQAGEINGYFHATNASATTWEKLAPAVQQYFGDRIKELVSMEDWVAKLEKSATDQSGDINSNPGLKLLDSYRGMASNTNLTVLDLKRTNQRSTAATECPTISIELLAHWFRQWGFTGTSCPETHAQGNKLSSVLSAMKTQLTSLVVLILGLVPLALIFPNTGSSRA